MPKIPTFTAQGTPTAQVGGVTTNLKLSPFATPAAALVPVAQKAEEYYLKQRDRTDTIEANKVRIEIKSKADEIIGREKNNIDEFNSVNNFSTNYDNFLKIKLDSIQNKRVKSKVENLVSLDTPDYIYQIKKNSRTASDIEDTNVYNTLQEQTASRHYVTNDPKLKKSYEEQMIFNASQYNKQNNLGKTALDKDVKAIKSDLFLSDVDKLIANKEYTKAENKLKDINSSPFLDNDDREKRLIKIQKEGFEYRATSYGVGQILQGKNPLIGEGIKGTTDKKIIDATDNTLISIAQKNKFNEEQTFAFVDDTYAKVGMVSNLYEETIDSGYTAGSSTTFDNEADIPEVLLQAVKVSEVADKFGRLSVYTDEKQQTFFENVIVAKKILGLDNFQAIKTAREMENNYDLSVIKGANKARNRAFDKLETEFKNLKGTNLGEVKGYANKIFNMYVVSGIGPNKARELTVENIKKNLIVVDNYAYMRRDIDAFKSIGALGQIKSFKEYIVNEQMVDQDPDEYFLRYSDGGLFEIRRRLDISPVYNKDGQPMVYYPKDLFKMFKEREAKGKAEIKKEVQLEQEKKQKIKEETAITGIDVTGA
tara:strand:+ start:461 stop:2242 length:1782 start_codon:yes stop_codon:yes gene_type:complete